MTDSRQPFFQIGIRSLLLIVFGFGVLFVIIDYTRARFSVGYTSRAIIQIQPIWLYGNGMSEETAEKICELPHLQHLSAESTIQSCLERSNLFVLDSFANFSKEEAVAEVINNLIVKRSVDSGNIFTLELQLESPQDSATMVNNLVNYYYSELMSENPPFFRKHFVFRNLEVARIGNIIEPEQSTNLLLGALIASAMVMLTLFPLNPFDLSQNSFSFGGVVATLIFGLFCFCTGFFIFSFLSRQPVYHSSAVVEIQDNCVATGNSENVLGDRLAKLSKVPHEFVIRSYAVIETALEQNNLFILDSFSNMSKEEAVRYVQDNLKVKKVNGNGNKFELESLTIRPQDCERIVDGIIRSYFQALDDFGEAIEIKAKVAATENQIGLPDEFGIPVQYESELLSKPSPSQLMYKESAALVPKILAGWTTFLLGFVVLLIWSKSTRETKKTAESINAPAE